MLSSKLRYAVSIYRPHRKICFRFASYSNGEIFTSDESNDRRESSLQQNMRSLPHIQILNNSTRYHSTSTERTIVKRWKSSVSPTTQEAMVSTKTESLKKSSQDSSSDDGGNSSDAVTPVPSSLRSRMTHRAECYRDSARERYEEFREHPGESAKAGAKSIGGMIRLYGPVFVGTYFSIYLATLGALYTGVESGVLDPITIIGMMSSSGEPTSTSTVEFVYNFMNSHSITKPYTYIIEQYPSTANLAVAWIAVKFTEPLRLAVALSVTPRVARYFGYTPKINLDEAEKANDVKSSVDDSSQKLEDNNSTDKSAVDDGKR